MLKLPEIQAILAVFAGGGIGSILRYSLAVAINQATPRIFPIHTLIANVLGCFIIGVVFAFFAGKSTLPVNLKLFLTVGFCGGLTTFSTFSFETVNLLQNQNYTMAGIYVFLSGVLCFASVSLGLITGGAIGRNV